MAEYKLDILTPKLIVIKDKEIDSITISTVKGLLQVLPNHTHIIEKLEAGIIDIKSDEGNEEFFVAGGICKLLDGKITILCEECIKKSDINKSEANKTLSEVSAKLVQTDGLSIEEINELRAIEHNAQIQIDLSVE